MWETGRFFAIRSYLVQLDTSNRRVLSILRMTTSIVVICICNTTLLPQPEKSNFSRDVNTMIHICLENKSNLDIKSAPTKNH